VRRCSHEIARGTRAEEVSRYSGSISPLPHWQGFRRILTGTNALRLKLSKPGDHDILPDVIRHVGNYGEVYERNVGAGSKLGIPRGLNQLWNAGGILYAPPIR